MRQRLFSVRIQRWPLKLAYIVVVYFGVGDGVGFGLRWLRTPELVVQIITGLLHLALLLYAARIFRGRYEEVEPPRLWWQMTARAKLSRRLGILASFGVLFAIVAFVVSFFVPPRDSVSDGIALVDDAIRAYLYLGSAVRLGRRERLLEPEVWAASYGSTIVDVPGSTLRVQVIETKATAAESGSQDAFLRLARDRRGVDVMLGGQRI
ncbi:hypothetical protein AX769_07895 [Frondihabitans sp. PAMC 28766]|uniref:hypothetical protein n=1 Tax=Frondihabitans sp. PAMC 28766 TaxID=1795630 RepID=UPI00078EE066|nr:hypothetical protein [Frondihabitans sp. PAMC 28766]AMM20102.1 hypothetical protein AX769_07895 [Frondihabitans sp. PAMC 28766]